MKDISLHLMDIIQNSVAAKASNITVKIFTDEDAGELKITVSDDGTGMDKELLSEITSPFVTTRTTRKVGLGISLLKASAEITGGKLEILSEKGKGTVVRTCFKISSIDRIPLGDVSETIASVVSASPGIDFNLLLGSGKGNFAFRTSEIKDKLGEVPISDYDVLRWIKDYISEGIMSTFGGVLNEIDS